MLEDQAVVEQKGSLPEREAENIFIFGDKVGYGYGENNIKTKVNEKLNLILQETMNVKAEIIQARRQANEIVSIVTEMKEEMEQGESRCNHSNDGKHARLAKKRPKFIEQEDATIVDKIPRKQSQQEEEDASNILERLEVVKPGPEFEIHQNSSLIYNEILQAARQIDGRM